jgi:hypothetical protein
MGLGGTVIVYMIIGSAVAAAIWMARGHVVAAGSVPQLAVWIVFWPFFAPVVLGRAVALTPAAPVTGAPGETGSRLREAQERLRVAIGSVEGLGEGVLRPHLTQIDTMMRALDHAESRLRDMDALLGTREFDVTQVEAALHELRDRGYEDDEPRVRSLLSRRRNIERLRAMRERTCDELERALLRMEEISSQVMLLRFAEQPETRLAALLKDIAGSVDDLAKAALEMNDLC